jgi:hypothetical protein
MLEVCFFCTVVCSIFPFGWSCSFKRWNILNKPLERANCSDLGLSETFIVLERDSSLTVPFLKLPLVSCGQIASLDPEFVFAL